MAGLHCAAAAASYFHHHLRHRITGTYFNRRKPIILISCASTGFSSRHSRRNFLRRKILRTLKEPVIPKFPPAEPVIPVFSPPDDGTESVAIEETHERNESEEPEAGNDEDKLEEVREVDVSVLAGVSTDERVGILAKKQNLMFGLWLVGAYVFHAVCAIWVFDLSVTDNDTESLNRNERNSLVGAGGNGKCKSDVALTFKGADSMYMDGLEIQNRIEEIRAMAREAREKERLEKKKVTPASEDEDSEEDNGVNYHRNDIGEEVDNRLVKLRKKLQNARGKKVATSIDHIKSDDKIVAEVETGDEKGKLLFKKKYKFRGSFGDPVEKPKGFTGSGDKDNNISKATGNLETVDQLFRSLNDASYADDLGNGKKQSEPFDPMFTDKIPSLEEDKKSIREKTYFTRNTKKKVEKSGPSKKGKGVPKPKSKVINGIVPKENDGRLGLEGDGDTYGLRQSRDLESAHVADELSDLRSKGVDDDASTVYGGNKMDVWWYNLPYVLVVLMRRGRDGEGGEGLYTLKCISNTGDQVSHIVAFEDGADATNFCYVVESFFEDLADFEADVIPLTVNELNEAAKSWTGRTVVVKKGQLKLYAGQPLTDVEMALRDMTART